MLLGSRKGQIDRGRKRSKRGRPRRAKSAPAIMLSDITNKRRKRWTNESMCAAIQSVEDGSSVSQAARAHGVPYTTLYDRIVGNVCHGTNPGPRPYLSKCEEKDLSDFLVEVAKAGYGKSRQQVKTLATKAVREKVATAGYKESQQAKAPTKTTISGRCLLNPNKCLSNGWYYRFINRHHHLVLRKGDPTANVRMDSVNKETMNNYFTMLKDTLTENGLLDSPSQIYNVDETGMPLDHRPPKIVTVKGQKKVRSRTSGNKSQITVIACVSAVGHVIPPFVIFDSKGLNYQWTKGEVVGTRYGLSSTGWVDTDLFKSWLNDHLLKYAVGSRPLLLILDGHSTHYQPALIKYAKENQVILLCLPPHTTHESQPLDASVFKPLKQN